MFRKYRLTLGLWCGELLPSILRNLGSDLKDLSLGVKCHEDWSLKGNSCAPKAGWSLDIELEEIWLYSGKFFCPNNRLKSGRPIHGEFVFEMAIIVPQKWLKLGRRTHVDLVFKMGNYFAPIVYWSFGVEFTEIRSLKWQKCQVFHTRFIVIRLWNF